MMDKIKKTLVIIGGGPAGLAAANAAHRAGITDLLLIERDNRLGGILNQCIHDGFGLHYFGELLTGPEYAERLMEDFNSLELEAKLNTTVLKVTDDLEVHTVSREGYAVYKADAVIAACGCRERPAGAIALPGNRPAGIYSAGACQRMMNLENIKPGSRAVIIGSGDIGLIMARRLTWENIPVAAVVEIMPYSNGLERNVQQCLNDYDIPLYLSSTIKEIRGKDRIEGLTVCRVNEKFEQVAGTEFDIDCDTLLLSVGLIPENEIIAGAGVELSPLTGGAVVNELFMSSVPGIFCCGNALHVHDLADYASKEAEKTAWAAAAYIAGKATKPNGIKCCPLEGVRYVKPDYLSGERDEEIAFRSTRKFDRCSLELVDAEGRIIATKQVRHIYPAEMQYLTIKAEDVAKCGGQVGIRIK